MLTVAELIKQLQLLPQELPVFINTPYAREGEYVAVSSVVVDHLKNQDTSGDPEHHWVDVRKLDEEELKEFKESGGNQIGQLVLID